MYRMKTDYVKFGIKFIIISLILLAFYIGYAFYADASDLTPEEISSGKDFVNQIADKSFDFILDPANSKEAKLENLKENLISKIDFDFISAFVLGANYRTMTDDQKSRFQKVFKEINLYSYSDKFSGYSNAKLEILNTEDAKDKKQMYVNFVIYPSGKEDTSNKLDSKLRLRKTGEDFKIVDVTIAGISMAMTYRNDFKSVMDTATSSGQDPIETLIKKLEEKVAEKK